MQRCVQKQETFYLSGYDPRGARHYHSLYRKEASRQPMPHGGTIKVSARKRITKHIQKWDVHLHDKEGEIHTQYHFLEWDDLIRNTWRQSPMQVFADMGYYIRQYIVTGLFFKYLWIIPRQTLGFFYPSFYFIVSLLLSVFTALFSFKHISSLINEPTALILSSLLAAGMLRVIWYLGDTYAAFWLLRIFVFSARYVFTPSDVLQKRINVFADYIHQHIRTAKQRNIKEIIIVSHSVGTIMTIPLLALLTKQLEKEKSVIPKLTIITLGECIPLVSGIPQAVEFRKQMEDIAQNRYFHWFDYTSVIDGACFPGLDFFEDSHIPTDHTRFHFLSPRFHTLFSKARYKRLKKNKYLAHFLYLMATEKTEGYNFFTLTAGRKDSQMQHAKPKEGNI